MSDNDNNKLIPRGWFKAGAFIAVGLLIVGVLLPDRYNALELLLSLVITWTVYLVPPVLMRLANKEPFSVWWAVGLCVVLWFVYHIVFAYLGSDGKVGSAVLGILAAFFILRRGAQPDNDPTKHLAKPTGGSEINNDSDRGWGKK